VTGREPPRTRPLAALLPLLALAAGCATTAHPAHAPLAPETQLAAGDGAERAAALGWEAVKRGDAAREAGKLDEARAEWTRGADHLLAAAAESPRWRLALGFRAAELLRRAGDDERAAGAAARIAADPAADPLSRAMARHLEAQALHDLGAAQAKAGKLPSGRPLFADERNGAAPAPRPLAGTWKRFVEAVEAYLPLSATVTEPAPPVAGPPLLSPARLAVAAARVRLAFDDVAGARGRLAEAMERWPDDHEAAAEAIPLYLQTYLVAGDAAGFRAEAARLAAALAARAEKADDPTERAGVAREQEELEKALSDADFGAANRLLEAGKPGEAAEVFEAIASRGDAADAAGALHNAAIAWDRAGEPARAQAARARILEAYPESRVAPTNALFLAAEQARRGDHPAAAKLYGQFLERWPEHGSRCIALQNLAVELDAARRGAEAAERYLAFGKDAACAKADPKVALVALRRARTLFDAAGKPARAREAADAITRGFGLGARGKPVPGEGAGEPRPAPPTEEPKDGPNDRKEKMP
jgi:tetratricopeptide (TPR) repeat protein